MPTPKLGKRKRLLSGGGSNYKSLKKIQPGQYVVFKNRHGKVVKEPSHTIKLVAEVRDRKTKGLVGFINHKSRKSGEPILRTFSKRFQNFLGAKRRRAQETFSNSFTFRIKTSRRIKDEIAEKGVPAARAIQRKAREDGFCLFSIFARDFDDQRRTIELRTPTMNIPKGTPIAQITYDMAMILWQSLGGFQVRTSPKPMSRNKKAKHLRSLIVTVRLHEVEDLF